MRLFLVLFSLFAIFSLRAQCVINSTDGYQVHVTITPQTVIVSSTDCANGYNYNIGYHYNVTFTGVNIPSSLYTLQTLITCNGQINGGYGMPTSGGTGNSVTTTNPFINNNGTVYQYSPLPSCTTATVYNLPCNAIQLIIEGPGIPHQEINCSFTGTPLPVELIDFTGKRTAGRVDLEWNVASETDCAFYTLERSKDGSTWSKTGDYKGAGTVTSALKYRAADLSPGDELNYYRLSQTDNNGTHAELGIISIQPDYQNENVLRLFPNPSEGEAMLTYNSETDGDFSYAVYDQTGRLVAEETTLKTVKEGKAYRIEEKIILPETPQICFMVLRLDSRIIATEKLVRL